MSSSSKNAVPLIDVFITGEVSVLLVMVCVPESEYALMLCCEASFVLEFDAILSSSKNAVPLTPVLRTGDVRVLFVIVTVPVVTKAFMDCCVATLTAESEAILSSSSTAVPVICVFTTGEVSVLFVSICAVVSSHTIVSLCVPSVLCSVCKKVLTSVRVPAGSIPSSVSMATIAAPRSFGTLALARVLLADGVSTSRELFVSSTAGKPEPLPEPSSLINRPFKNAALFFGLSFYGK